MGLLSRLFNRFYLRSCDLGLVPFLFLLFSFLPSEMLFIPYLICIKTLKCSALAGSSSFVTNMDLPHSEVVAYCPALTHPTLTIVHS